MRIHHLNCGTCCPPGGRLFDGTTDAALGHLVCHCLLIESDDGLILIDTGFGVQDVERPRKRLSEFFLQLNQPQLCPEETALAQIRALGFSPADVRHIVITHLDFDHAGGIEDFPNAAVHLTARERKSPMPGAADASLARVATGRPSGTGSATGGYIRSAAANAGSGSTRFATSMDFPPKSCSFRWQATPGGIVGSRSDSATAGCSMSATPISFVVKWVRPIAARREWRAING